MSEGLGPVQLREDVAASFPGGTHLVSLAGSLSTSRTLLSIYLFFKTQGFVNTEFKELFPKHSQFSPYLETETWFLKKPKTAGIPNIEPGARIFIFSLSV